MNDDQLDRMLHSLGERWRDGQPPAAGVDAATLTGSPRPRWLAPVAAAAAVAVIVGGAAAVLGDGGEKEADPGPVATPSDASAVVVPWEDLPAAHEQLPEPEQQWDPAPDYAAGTPTCTSEQVRLVPAFMLEEGTLPYAEISVNALPGERCAMPTDAEVVFLAGGQGAEQVAGGAYFTEGWPGDAVLLQGEGNGYVSLKWDAGSCPEGGDESRADTLELRWGGGSASVPIPLKFGRGPEGDLEPQSQPACLTEALGLKLISPLTTLGAGEVPGPSPYEGLEIEQVGYEPAGADGLETWLIQLTATEQELPLADCPDARVGHSYNDADGALRDETHRYRMNCDWSGMPTDSDGDPVLPVGEPVVFTVKAPSPSPAAGEQFFETTWTLMGPEPDGRVLERTLDQTQAPAQPAIVPEEEANYHLQISNQAFENEEVPLRVSIDSQVLIDEVFAVEGQHTWRDYPLSLAPGTHEVSVVSDDGGSYRTTIRVSADADTYGQLLYWQEDGEPEFTWTEQDHQFLWD